MIIGVSRSWHYYASRLNGSVYNLYGSVNYNPQLQIVIRYEDWLRESKFYNVQDGVSSKNMWTEALRGDPDDSRTRSGFVSWPQNHPSYIQSRWTQGTCQAIYHPSQSPGIQLSIITIINRSSLNGTPNRTPFALVRRGVTDDQGLDTPNESIEC